jgi:hypothetical protein
MSLHITKELTKKDKQYVDDELYKFNLKHFPVDLRGRYEESVYSLRMKTALYVAE